MAVFEYQDLVVWQRSMDLAEEVYRLARMLPKKELLELSSQMRRAAVSIPSNIAEGHDRKSSKEFIHFLTVARGSRSELETQLAICVRVGYLSESDISSAIALLREIGKMLNALIAKLSARS